MTLSDEIAKLQELRDSGTLTEAEFAQAKSRVLNSEQAAPSNFGAASEHRLMLMELQIELAQVDREWELEKDRHTFSGRYTPTGGNSLLRGTAVVVIGTLFLLMAVAAKAPAPFWLFGIVLIAAGIATGIRLSNKAAAYQQAEAAYEEKRAALLAQQNKLQRNDT